MKCLSKYIEEYVEKRNLNIPLFFHNTNSRAFLLLNIALPSVPRGKVGEIKQTVKKWQISILKYDDSIKTTEYAYWTYFLSQETRAQKAVPEVPRILSRRMEMHMHG